MRQLAVFARPPEPGRAKTRLSPALPPDLAAELCNALLGDALAVAASAPADRRWVYWAEPPLSPTHELTSGFEARAQTQGDLGVRLEHAFADMLRSPDDRAMVMGADCPALEPTTLSQAFLELEASDVVLGPTRDGGYYLIALRRPAPTLFEDIEWSTERVLAQTLDRAEAAGLRVTLLGKLDDLDTPEDLLRFVSHAAAGLRGAPRVRSALRRMGLLPDS